MCEGHLCLVYNLELNINMLMGKRELICLLLFTCNYVVSVWRGFLFLWVLGMGYVILLWHSLGLPLIILKFDDIIFVLRLISGNAMKSVAAAVMVMIVVTRSTDAGKAK